MAFQAEKARPPIPKDQWPADALQPIARPLSSVPKASDQPPKHKTSLAHTLKARAQQEQPHQEHPAAAPAAVTHKQATTVEGLKV